MSLHRLKLEVTEVRLFLFHHLSSPIPSRNGHIFEVIQGERGVNRSRADVSDLGLVHVLGDGDLSRVSRARKEDAVVLVDYTDCLDTLILQVRQGFQCFQFDLFGWYLSISIHTVWLEVDFVYSVQVLLSCRVNLLLDYRITLADLADLIQLSLNLTVTLVSNRLTEELSLSSILPFINFRL